MEWKECTVGQVVKTNISQYSIKENWKDIIYLDTGNITQGKIDSLQHFSNEDKVPSRARRKVKHGDIIYSCVRPNQKHFGYIENPPSNLLVSTGFVVITCIDVDSKYLYYYLTQDYITDFLHAVGEQAVSTYPTIRPSDVESVKIKIPNKVEDQRRIAAILSSLDRKIELNNKINAQLEEMAQAIFKNWFVDFEPFKDGKFVESELGMIPEGWRVGTIKDLADIKYGKDHKKLADGSIPVYGSGGLMRKAEKELYHGESVLIPRKGTLNNVLYVNESFWTVDTMFYSTPKIKNVMKFLYLFLSNKDLSSMNTGSAVPSMTTDILNKMDAVIPVFSVLEKFDEILDSLFIKLAHNKKESEQLSELRDTLLPKLMSGEINIEDYGQR